MCVARDNFFKVISLNLFIILFWTNLVNSNVIYYRDNNKCNVCIYIYIYIIIVDTKLKQYNFFMNSKVS